MSAYVYRYIEIYKEAVDGSVWEKKDLPAAEKHEGEIFKINVYNRPENVAPYYKAEAVCSADGKTEYDWLPVYKVEKKWIPVKWYSFLPKNRVIGNKDPYYKPKYKVVKDDEGKEFFIEENIYWCDAGGCIRDKYIRKGAFSDRGLPEDVSEEVKNDIESDSTYGKTWVLLTEWQNAFETAKNEFAAEVRKRFAKENDEEISKKLDIILATIKDPNYKPKKKIKKNDEVIFYEDTVEYLFDEWIYDLFTINMEIDRTEFILNEFDLHYGLNENARIIYCLA